MKLLITLLLSLVPLTLALSNEDERVEMIMDVVKSYEKPTVVTAFACWKSKTKLNLTIRLGKLKNPISIRFANQRTKIFEVIPKDVFIVVDLDCPTVGEFLKEADKNKMFKTPHRWLVIGEKTNDDEIIPHELKFYNIAFNSEVIIAKSSAELSFELYQVYQVHENSLNKLTEYYGTWTATNGLNKSKDMETTAPLRRKNLRKEPIAVTFNINDHEIGVDLKDCDFKIYNSQHSVTRWGMQQILILYDFVNASRITYFTDEWGYLVNGTWNGVIGNMARGEVDLSGTPIFMSKQRTEFANYLINPVQTAVKFVFREPPLSYQNNLFLLPFHRTVWYCLAGFVVILTLVIYLNAQWEVRKLRILDSVKDEEVSSPENKFTLSDVALTMIGAISQQGCFIELRGFMGRLLMFILFLSFLFLFTAYSASIVALLQSSSKQIRTLSDLLNSRLELGVQDTSYNRYYFASATDPVRKAIYETKVAPRGSTAKFTSLEDGVKKLRKHPFAFNMDIGEGYGLVEKYFYEHEKCGLQEITYIPLQRPWMTCRKDSPYSELFKISYYRIREHGMGHRANTIVFSKKPVCAVSGGSFDSVSIIDVYPCLLFLLYGMILAFTLFLIEVFRHRRLNKTSNTEAETISLDSSF